MQCVYIKYVFSCINQLKFNVQFFVHNMTILVITISGETENAMGNDQNSSLLSNMQVLMGTN